MSTRVPFFVPAFLTLASLMAGHASAQIVPLLDPEAAGIGQCMRQLDFTPQESVAMAEKRLAAGGLAPFNEISWLGCLGIAKGAVGRPEEITALVRRARKIADTHWSEFNEMQQAMALVSIGNALRASGDLAQAMTVLQRIETLKIGTLSNADLATQYKISAAMIMGEIYGIALNAPEAAESYFRHARDLSEGHALRQQVIDYQYAYTLLKLKRYDEVRPLLDELARKLEKSPDDAVLRYRVNTQRAVILDAGERHEEAAAMFAAALTGQREVNDLNGQAYTLIQIANHQWIEGKRDAAIASAQQARSLAQQGRFAQEEEDASRLLAKIHESGGESAQALAALKRADELTQATLKTQNLHNRIAVDAALKQADDASADDKAPARDETSIPLVATLAAVALLALAASGLWLRERGRNRTLSKRDALTGLPNRQAMTAHLAAAPASRRALLLASIDKLDAINDLHGYDVGDRVLRQLAKQLRASCAAQDLVARWSGDSFLVVIEGASFEEANARAEQLRRLAEENDIDLSDGDALKISVSIGLAPLPFFPQDGLGDWHDSLRLANRALQSARRVGANAWASIWGQEAKGNRSTITIAQAPLQAAESGQVRLEASSHLAWQA